MELVMPSEAHAGAPVTMDLRITNAGEEPVTLWWSGGGSIPPSYYLDIVVFADGTPVWRATRASRASGGGQVTLRPDAERGITSLFAVVAWDQRADCGKGLRYEPCGEPLPPGVYTVRGVATVSREASEGTPPTRIAIATQPRSLVIMP